MPQTSFPADAFGVATLILFSLYLTFSLYCIAQTIYFRFRVQLRPTIPQLGYFNGPWFIRVTLTLISLIWGFGEILRSGFIKRKINPNLAWQRDICKGYIISNLGFAEPSILFGFVLLLHASLQKRETGTLSRRWNARTICYMVILCVPVLIIQSLLIFTGPKFIHDELNNGRRKLANYFTRTSYLVDTERSTYICCTYPLLTTILLGLVDSLLICYALYIGSRMLSLVINKGLRKRVSLLILAVLLLIPIRVLLLGFSVLPRPGGPLYETLVFLSFLVMMCCTTIGTIVLVYYPVSDSLALRELNQREIGVGDLMPYDDYYNYDGVSLIANQSNRDLERNSETSTKRGSISFRTMIGPDCGLDEPAGSVQQTGAVQAGSPPGSSPNSVSLPMLPLGEIPRY